MSSWLRIKPRTTVFLKLRDYTLLGGNSGLLIFLGLGFLLSWVGIQLRTTVFLTIKIYIIVVEIKPKATDFLKVRDYTDLGGNQTQDY